MAIDLDDPVALMLAASAAFVGAGIEAAAYGGLTLGMYGEPRETRDADLAVVGVAADTARDALDVIGVLIQGERVRVRHVANAFALTSRA